MGFFVGGAVSGLLWAWRPDAAAYGVMLAGLAGAFSVLRLAPPTFGSTVNARAREAS